MNSNSTLEDNDSNNYMGLILDLLNSSSWISVLGNALLIYTIATTDELRKLDCIWPASTMIFGDFFSAAAYTIRDNFIHQYTWEELNGTENDPLLKTKGHFLAIETPTLFGHSLSQLMAFVLAMDRYYALHKPVSYQIRNKQLTLYAPCLIGIFLSLVVALMPFYNSELDSTIHMEMTFPIWYRYFEAAFTSLVAFLVISTNVGILYALKVGNHFQGNEQTKFQIQKKVSLTVLSTLWTYASLWAVPRLIYNFHVMSQPIPESCCLACVNCASEMLKAVLKVGILKYLAFPNGAINIFLFYVSSSCFRHAIRSRIVPKMCSKKVMPAQEEPNVRRGPSEIAMEGVQSETHQINNYMPVAE